MKKLKGKKCWAGLDLASTRDISALGLLLKEDEKFLVVPYFFVPKENAKKRSEKYKVDYGSHITELARLREEAREQGAWSAAINAEVARGKAAGLYIDQKIIKHGKLEALSLKPI